MILNSFFLVCWRDVFLYDYFNDNYLLGNCNVKLIYKYGRICELYKLNVFRVF